MKKRWGDKADQGQKKTQKHVLRERQIERDR